MANGYVIIDVENNQDIEFVQEYQDALRRQQWLMRQTRRLHIVEPAPRLRKVG